MSNHKRNLLGQPSPPTELSLNTLDNKVTFEWKEGFNGGHAQTFVLETSPYSDDSWTKRLTIKESESKHLNGNGKFKVNLSNLEPGVYNARLVAFNIIGAADPVEFKKRFEIMKLNQETLSRDSVGPVIGGTVGGIIAALVVLIVAVVILRRKYTCSIRFAKREDLSQSEVRADIPDNTHLYMPLDESSSKSDVHYQNVKKEDPVYNNTVLKNSAQTEL
ncbi:hypothetical protein MAR_021645 [Mya arenaria]|uniref:Uncharacterized protein n=1 Tax=Mya arenaria TaxID=6604 RepID=A0ABY7EBL2_MYAAR|nr:hypothetical protein MAR_021645 [Mya arenaria]